MSDIGAWGGWRPAVRGAPVWAALAAGALLTSLAGAGQTAASRPGGEASAWRIAARRLANGLDVRIVPVHTAPSVAMELWYRVGSRDDPPDWPGLAHLCQELMFSGEVPGEPAALVGALARYGGLVVGETSFDYTRFATEVPRGALEQLLWLEAQRMAGVPVTPEAVRAGVEAMSQRIASRREQPLRAAMDRLLPVALAGSAYGHHPLGDPAVLAGVEPETVAAFRSRYYVPGNAVLVLVGDVEPDEGFALVERYFGDVETAKAPARARVAVQPRVGERALQVSGERSVVAAEWVLTGLNAEERSALRTLQALLAPPHGALSSYLGRRFGREVVQASAAVVELEQATVFVVVAVAGRQAPADLAPALANAPTHLAGERLSEAQVEPARNAVLSDLARALLPFSQHAFRVAHDTVLFADSGYTRAEFSRLRGVTAESLRSVAGRHLKAEAALRVIMTPSVPATRPAESQP